MQKNLLYLLLLIIVGAGVYFLVFKKKENVFGKTEASFTIKDTSDIGRVFLARSNGESITLTRTDSGWTVNEKYKAHVSTLAGLMRTLKTQEAQAPVAENQHNSVITSLAGSSVKVEIYNRDGDKMRVFYVGGQSYNYGGTYMLLEGAKKPFQVKIPGFQGILAPYYNTDLADWRDRGVFRLAPDEIKTIRMEYPEEPLNSFTIQNGDNLNVEVDPAIKGSKSLNAKKAKAYLSFYENVNCEGYLMGVHGIDSILSTVPKVCIIDVTNKKGSRQHVEIYRMPLTKRSKNIHLEEAEYDVDRFYAVMNNFQDTAIVQRWSFENLWRRGFEFYEEEKPVNVMGVPPTGKR
jgi:hypothetical protein